MKKAYNNLQIILCLIFVLIFIFSLGCNLKKKSDDDNNTSGSGSPLIPLITKTSRTQAKQFETISIEGNYFGNTQSTSYVTFNTTKAISYPNWDNKKVRVVVPGNATSGNLNLTTSKGTSNSKYFKILYSPIIKNISSQYARVNFDTVILKGEYFGSTKIDLKGSLRLDSNYITTNIKTWNDTTIIFSLTNDIPSGGYKLFLNTVVGSDSSNFSIKVIHKPTITRISPNPVDLGSYLEIYGTDFIDYHTNSYLKINDTLIDNNYAGILQWQENIIRLKITDEFTTGKLNIITSLGSSNEIDFQIQEKIAGWAEETIKPVGNISDTTSFIAAIYDSSKNKIHVVYTDVVLNNPYLKYVTKSLSSSKWDTGIVDIKGLAPSIILNKDGMPNVLYYNDNNSIKLARYKSGLWETTTIDSGTKNKKLKWPSTSIEADSSGIIHAVYNINNSGQTIRYAKISDSTLLLETKNNSDTTIADIQLSLALKNDNRPLIGATIAFTAVDVVGKPNKLVFYENTSDTTWENTEKIKGYYPLSTLDSTASFGGISLKKDIQGLINIVFVDGSNAELTTGTGIKDGGIFYSYWSEQQKLNDIMWENPYSSRLFNLSQNKYISMNNSKIIAFTVPKNAYSVSYQLNYMTYNPINSSWILTTLKDNINSAPCELIQDKAGNIHIFYYDSLNLKHINYYESVNIK